MADLDEIPTSRMPQLQGGPSNKDDQQRKEQERQEQAQQMKNQMLSQILDQQARARLNTLMVAKPEKAQMVENMLMNMARMGQLRGKIGETELIQLLEQVSKKTTNTTKVKFDRRRSGLDSDDDEYLDL